MMNVVAVHLDLHLLDYCLMTCRRVDIFGLKGKVPFCPPKRTRLASLRNISKFARAELNVASVASRVDIQVTGLKRQWDVRNEVMTFITSSGVSLQRANLPLDFWFITCQMIPRNILLLAILSQKEKTRKKMGEGYSKDHWKKDSAIAACRSCDAKFGAANRRHHCRNCGDIFCGKCAFRTIAVPPRGIRTPVRVCDECYMVLLEDQQNDNPQNPSVPPPKAGSVAASDTKKTQNQTSQNQPPSADHRSNHQSESATQQQQQQQQQPVPDMRIRKLLQKLAEIKASASESFLTMTFAVVDQVQPDDAVDYNDGVDLPDTAMVPAASDKLAPQQVVAMLLGPLPKRATASWPSLGRNVVSCSVNGPYA